MVRFLELNTVKIGRNWPKMAQKWPFWTKSKPALMATVLKINIIWHLNWKIETCIGVLYPSDFLLFIHKYQKSSGKVQLAWKRPFFDFHLKISRKNENFCQINVGSPKPVFNALSNDVKLVSIIGRSRCKMEVAKSFILWS